MNLSDTLIVYTLLGVTVDIYLIVAFRKKYRTGQLLFVILLSPICWPIFLPVMLAGREITCIDDASPEMNMRDNPYIRELVHIESTLLQTISQQPEKIQKNLDAERPKLKSLFQHLHQVVGKIIELEALLTQEEFQEQTIINRLMVWTDQSKNYDSALHTAGRQSLENCLMNIKQLNTFYKKYTIEFAHVIQILHQINTQMMVIKYMETPQAIVSEKLEELFFKVEQIEFELNDETLGLIPAPILIDPSWPSPIRSAENCWRPGGEPSKPV